MTWPQGLTTVLIVVALYAGLALHLGWRRARPCTATSQVGQVCARGRHRGHWHTSAEGVAWPGDWRCRAADPIGVTPCTKGAGHDGKHGNGVIVWARSAGGGN
jgi:hypothetical protein